MTTFTIDVERRALTDSRPTGLVGTISFRRLIDQFRVAGEIDDKETITHLRINVERGTIEYSVEKVKP